MNSPVISIPPFRTAATAALAIVMCGCKPNEATPKVGLQLHVSLDGSDARDGRSAAGAFRTISRARDEIRAIKRAGRLPAGGVAVEIAGGRYGLTETLEFTAEDSGSPQAPVFYRARNGQQVSIAGGRALAREAFRPVEDPAVVKRLDPSARGKIRSLDMEALALAHAGPFPEKFDDHGGVFELFWNGRRLPLSRWPNEGWTTMKRAVVNGDHRTPGVFEYRDDRPSRWMENPNVWLKGQWRVPWEEPAIRVARIDSAARTIAFAKGIQLGIGNKYTRPEGNGKEPWCAINLLEEIDRPGEWCIDFATRTLYLWPPDDPGELWISQLAGPVIAANGASWLRFCGLTIEGSLGDGIVLENSESNEVNGCVFRNLAGFGVKLDGFRSSVRSCDMHDLGAGCILVSGGDSKRLVPSGNEIVNNHLHHYGRLKPMYSAAVDVGFGGAPNYDKHRPAVGIRVAHNLIHDGPRDAVLVTGQDNVFEFNEIFRCGFASDDLGAFYSWFDWTIRGIIIRHNYIHNTVGGVNPDDGASGNLVHGNIFAGPRTGVWVASGPDHTTRHNLFIKNEGPALGIDDRGESRGYATNPRLVKPVEALQPGQPPWSERFPEMSALLAERPGLPLRNRFEDNVIVIQKGDPVLLKMSAKNKADPQLFSQRGNFVTAEDPGFVDLAGGNLALRRDSVVFSRIPGFPPIPFEKIGLFKDAWRKQLPSAGAIGRPTHNPMFHQDHSKNFGTL